MGEQEWLEQGHGTGDALRAMIEGPVREAGERKSNGHVLRGTHSGAPRKPSPRRNKVLVAWLVYCCIAGGGTAAAWTVRETLFPSLGAPTTRTLLDNPRTDTNVPTSTDAATPSTKVVETSLDEATVATTPESSIETVASGPAEGSTDTTVDDHRANAAHDSQTDTTVAADGPHGQPVSTVAADGPGGEPVTTVDEHQTTGSTAASVSNPPASIDPARTRASTPGTVATVPTPDHHSDEGGGNGGGSPTSTP